MTSYQVKFWDVKKIGDTAKGRWRVRWAVAGREHCKSFAAKPLADGFLTDLKNAAAAARQPFDETTGLPAQSGRAAPSRSWYDHARAYAEMKWPHLAPKSRRSTAEALTTVTLALATRRRGAPDLKILNRALFGWAFNPGTRHLTPPEPIAAALDWAGRDLSARQRARGHRCPAGRARRVRRHPGRHARRGHHSKAQALGPVQRGRLRRRAAPLGRQPPRPHPVDRPRGRRNRRPPGRGQPRVGSRAAGRGSRARQPGGAPGSVLRVPVLRGAAALRSRRPAGSLPSRGWGRIDLAISEPRAGRDWTDHGTARQARGLKHRAANEIRSIPIPPALVTLLRAPLKTHGTIPDGRLFRTAAGPCKTAPSGRPPAPPRSPPPSKPPRWPAAPTTCATPPSPYGSTPASRRPKSPGAPGTASPSCSRSTPTASTAKPAPSTNASPTPSAVKRAAETRFLGIGGAAVWLKAHELHRRPGRHRQPAHHRGGAGSMPAARRISQAAGGATARPSLVSSPCIRRYPHSGFSFASGRQGG
jgi:hypothetical protein